MGVMGEAKVVPRSLMRVLAKLEYKEIVNSSFVFSEKIFNVYKRIRMKVEEAKMD